MAKKRKRPRLVPDLDTSIRCKICGNPDIDVKLSGPNPNKAVCDWTCACLLNKKLIISGSIIGIFAIYGSILISYWFLIIFIPFSLFFLRGWYLIISKSNKKKQDRLKFIGEEDEEETNIYTR